MLVSAFRVRNKPAWSSNFADSLIIIAESRNWTGPTPILTKKIDSINYDFASFKLWNRCDMNEANEPFRQCIVSVDRSKCSHFLSRDCRFFFHDWACAMEHVTFVCTLDEVLSSITGLSLWLIGRVQSNLLP